MLTPQEVIDNFEFLDDWEDRYRLVIEEGKTQRKEVEHALDLLSSTNVLGTVLNKAGQ